MNQKPDSEDAIRPHTYDGIQEYDKRMPNWWLWTYFGMIAFSVGYWFVAHEWKLLDDQGWALETQMKANQLAAAQSTGEINDDKLWEMSKDAAMIAAGKATFDTTCASCHRPDLLGMIGPNLKDKQWVHGGDPLTVAKIINEGVAAKGMPPWAAVLGKTKVNEVTAYILSFHQKGEPVQIAPWVPVLAPPPAQ